MMKWMKFTKKILFEEKMTKKMLRNLLKMEDFDLLKIREKTSLILMENLYFADLSEIGPKIQTRDVKI